MKKKIIIGILVIVGLLGLESCSKFLDVIPDNIATLENAFTRRIEAEKYLFTCYSYMPRHGDLGDDPGMLAGDELWRFATVKGFMEVARGYQGSVSPLGDRWQHFYRAIRDCNTFLENVNSVPDLDEIEKRRWAAEVKFLKAYYHFYLLKMYGPIPIMKENLPVDIDEEKVNASRAPVDSVFSYVIQLIDEATEDIPFSIDDPARELGRITKPIALATKAQILVYAASPLFNGNTDQAGLKGLDGTVYFNPIFSKEKWDIAATACKEAIDACHEAGIRLYKYPGSFQFNLSDIIKVQLSLRNVITERWNEEIIWANTQTNSIPLQRLITPFLDPTNLDITLIKGELSPPLKMAELFYTENGVPLTEDVSWNYNNRYSLRTGEPEEELLIRKGYVTASLNFDREPRFYANLGFDGGVWYGQGRYDDKKPSDLFYLEAKFRQRNGFGKPLFGTVTGYYLKKYVHFENVIGKANDYSVTPYPFTIMRLADLYLLYAEALNESEGPSQNVYQYIDLVRERAGLKSVEVSWEGHSSNPFKFKTAEGLREIIHTERLIELAFEGQRFWDLRRWKKATNELNKQIMGWDLIQPSAVDYYRPSVIYNQTFGTKDYFWPIAEGTLSRNRNLVQNLGW